MFTSTTVCGNEFVGETRGSGALAMKQPTMSQPLVPRTLVRSSWPLYIRAIALASLPVMALILLLCCSWLRLLPSKRPQLHVLRARVSTEVAWPLAIWHFAAVLLERWPLFVIAILGTGAAVGLLIGGLGSLMLALVASVLGASLAPVFAHDLPAWLFPQK